MSADEATDAPPPPPSWEMTTDTMLMHPALAWVSPLTHGWTSHVPLAEPETYASTSPERTPETLARYGMTVLGTAATLNRWLMRRRTTTWDTQRGLIDEAGRKIWMVDFVCQIRGRCHILCIFYGNRRRLEPPEREYTRSIKRLALHVYRCDARVLAVKVYGEGRVFSCEIAAEEPPTQKGPDEGV